MINAIDHINIVVSNLGRSIQFYTRVLGFEHVNTVHLEGDWIDSIVGLKGIVAEVAFIIAPEGGPKIELLCYKTPVGESLAVHSQANTIGLRHFALRVNDIQACVKKLEEAGVKVLSKPIAVPSTVVSRNPVRKTLCYFLDPDKVLVELAEYH